MKQREASESQRSDDAEEPSSGTFAARSIEKRIVRRQMNRSGNILMSALEPMPPHEFFEAGLNGVSPAWTVGHLACVADLFTSWLDVEGLLLPRATHDVFNSLDIGNTKAATKAETVDPDRYSKADILLMLRRAQVKALGVLDAFDVRRWEEASPEPVPDSLPTCGSIWEHLAVHTYWHLGEISGSVPRFHGTYTVNTVLHYFFAGVDGRGG